MHFHFFLRIHFIAFLYTVCKKLHFGQLQSPYCFESMIRLEAFTFSDSIHLHQHEREEIISKGSGRIFFLFMQREVQIHVYMCDRDGCVVGVS